MRRTGVPRLYGNFNSMASLSAPDLLESDVPVQDFAETSTKVVKVDGCLPFPSPDNATTQGFPYSRKPVRGTDPFGKADTSLPPAPEYPVEPYRTPSFPASQVKHVSSHVPIYVSLAGPPEDSRNSQAGKVYWEKTKHHGHLARWPVQLDPDLVKDTIRPYLKSCGFSDANYSVQFLARGGWNRAYTVATTELSSGVPKELVLRFIFPVQPWYKVHSEVATMEYVRIHTSIPLPKVYAFDSSTDNPLGLEWILMGKVRGRKYAEVRGKLDYDTKRALIKTIADWVD
ncbi:hypothetical protein M501DRAFT_869907 [Patellaria atrata CBS 101060]|uniref:Aminoglycoside phosphotransferase domain-containing protein n=1 Tax=Patellaria atrata CBS 101060 TaxID=1346257 RepID=A0A9P4VQZ0_9PEZI|nr:hypothetical protein M501DRAFT_869907 [Patellaria atrata CBS 101060]